MTEFEAGLHREGVARGSEVSIEGMHPAVAHSSPTMGHVRYQADWTAADR